MIWRDSGNWAQFRGLWHPGGVTCSTWFRGPVDESIALSRRAFDSGVAVGHQLGGTAVDVRGDRAVAQTKVCIQPRAEFDGVEVDVACHGRFYDFLADESRRLVRRQPIYERDRLDPVLPGATVDIDLEVVARFRRGYRFSGICTTPGLRRPDRPARADPAGCRAAVRAGRMWLSGAGRADVTELPAAIRRRRGRCRARLSR